MKKMKEYCISIFIVVYLLLLIAYSEEIANYAIKAIQTCIYSIIPTLYIFMITSDFIITSNIYILLSKPFALISRYIFRIPEQLFPIYIISNVGGYPIGAKLISDLQENNTIDSKTAQDMMSYCYMSGPAFIFGIVGTQIFSNINIGIIIFLSIVAANLVIAVIIGLKHPIPECYSTPITLNITLQNIIMSIYNGGKSIFRICTIIIFFSSIICILETSGIISFIAYTAETINSTDYSSIIAFIKSFIEISNISSFEAQIKNIPLIAALLSFGGICIVLQIKSIIKIISLKHFIFLRIVAMILTYLICKLFCFISYNATFYVYSPAQITHSQNSPITTFFLLIMTILFLLKISIENERKI